MYKTEQFNPEFLAPSAPEKQDKIVNFGDFKTKAEKESLKDIVTNFIEGRLKKQTSKEKIIRFLIYKKGLDWGEETLSKLIDSTKQKLLLQKEKERKTNKFHSANSNKRNNLLIFA
jgi:hypothetical protein